MDAEKQKMSEIVTKIFNNLYKKDDYKIRKVENDILLNGQEISYYVFMQGVRSKIGKLYERIFSELCNLNRPGQGFDLFCKDRKIYIELKNTTNTDNFDSKNSKFNKLKKFKSEHQDCEVLYICMNESRNKYPNGVDYVYENSFRIITGDIAWDYMCQLGDISKQDLIEILRKLFDEYLNDINFYN